MLRIPRAEGIAWLVAVGLGAACVPAIWWEPLHLDERVMLELSRGSPWAIIQNVFVDRGGAPAQFMVERLTLVWPGGLAGLRGPSLVFFLVALPCAGLLARRLSGRTEAIGVPLLLATAPLAVELATFARMYSLFLLLVIVTAIVATQAGLSRSRAWWIAAGVLGSGLVYIHPIAPLYAAPAFACGLVVGGAPLRKELREARPGLIAAAIVAVPYLYGLAVLRDRYGVGETGRLSTTAGRTVPEEALRSLSPSGLLGLTTFCVLALAGAVLLYRERRQVAILLMLWVSLPIAFFTVVPAETRFFGRYVLPALPAFLVLVVAGCRLLGRRHPFIAALFVLALGLGAIDASDRLAGLRQLDLRGLSALPHDAVLFSSTGSPTTRPPELLDDLVALEHSPVVRVEELAAIDPRYEKGLVAKGVRNVRTFLSVPGERRGVWVFRGSPRRVKAAERRLRAVPGVNTKRAGDQFLVVTSGQAHDARALVELAVQVRTAWGIGAPNDRWPRMLVVIDQAALG